MKRISKILIITAAIALCLGCFCMESYAVREVYDAGSSVNSDSNPYNLPNGAMEALTGGGYIVSTKPGYSFLPPLSGNRTTYGTDYFTVGGHQFYDPGALAGNNSNNQSGFGVRETNPLDAIYGRGLHSIYD